MWQCRFLAKADPWQPVGATYLDGAITALDQAIRLNDSTAAELLATIVLEEPQARLRLDDAGLMERLLATLGRGPTGRRLRGRLLSMLGEDSLAAVEMARVREASIDQALAAAELARAAGMAGQRGFESLYYAGAASDDPGAVAIYRADIAYVADSSELAGFDRAQGAGRAAFLEDFWTTRDHQDLRPEGSRLREHFLRLAYARKHYALRQFPRRYDTYEPYRSGSSEFDDRGLMYIRHGPPDRVATYIEPGVCYNTTWLYARPDGNLVLHFLARTDVNDWRLIEGLRYISGSAPRSVFDTLSVPRRRGVLYDDCPYVRLGLVYESRIEIDPVYGRLVFGGRHVDRRQEEALVERSISTATNSDSHAHRFPVVLDIVGQAYGLLGESSEGRLLLVYAVASEGLEMKGLGDGRWRYDLALHFQATDTSYRTAWVDTLRRSVLLPQPLAPGDHVTGIHVFTLPAGLYHAGVLITQDTMAGQVVRLSAVRAGDSTAGQGLAMSDVVLGRDGSRLEWHAADGPFALNPLNTYSVAEAALLYYEVTGLAGGTYDTEISVHRLRNDRLDERRAVRLSFEEPARSGLLPVRRSLGLSQLEPGRYRVTVRIRQDGREVERGQFINVLKSAGPTP